MESEGLSKYKEARDEGTLVAPAKPDIFTPPTMSAGDQMVEGLAKAVEGVAIVVSGMSGVVRGGARIADGIAKGAGAEIAQKLRSRLRANRDG